jgi:O-acetyl-ADP-ribose deacetylase (regulator of RNase III)
MGYLLPAKHVIHTVGPVWHGGGRSEPELLSACYRNSLELAKEKGLKSVAFPAISTGVYGYPKEQAAQLAVGTIREFLADNEMEVILVAFGDLDEALYKELI